MSERNNWSTAKTALFEEAAERGFSGLVCPAPIPEEGTITLAHGSGGKLTGELVERIFLPAFGNPLLDKLNDQAVFPVEGGRLAFTTDAHVVSPLFFPGGDIGKLSVNGTLNDLAVSGAIPLYLSAAFILEEGLPEDELTRVVTSMREAAAAAGVQVVTGDTKVVDRGHGDGIFITTTGIGLVPDGVEISIDRARPGDKVLVSGQIAQHGMAIMARREGLDFDTEIESDTVALHPLVQAMLGVCKDIRVLRDPTRGGIATTLNEIAQRSRVSIVVDEDSIPIAPEVGGLCEILGIDPLYVANEGKLVAVVPPADADGIIEMMRAHRLGEHAAIIGEVVAEPPGLVCLRTCVGGTRVVDMPTVEQLPRIC